MCKRQLTFVFTVLLLCGQLLLAQDRTVTGVVTDAEDGMPLPGVNVVIKGTTTGASTDFDGNFAIQVSENTVLIFSNMGYATQEVPVVGKTTINIALSPDAQELEGVVVTALGIKRDAKALGYSLTEVDGEEFSRVKQTNAINSLAGKVAGVNVTAPTSGAAGSSRVVIRGTSSLSGENQPLYVIDGIPIDNTNIGSASEWGGSDFGDGISSINPDDIESVSVLKGGAASALYGSRASRGVIIITTKSGKGQDGLGVEYSSSLTFDTVNTDIYDFQKEYGQGSRGEVPLSSTAALDAAFSSWGARLDGSNVVQFDGVSRPYSDTGNNIKRFYRTANTFINTVAISSGGEKGSFRFSASDMTNKDITPNSGMNRKSFSLNASSILADKLTADISAKYIIEDVNNRPRLSDAPGNANFSVALLPANVDVLNFRPGYNDDDTEYRISSSIYQQNPYWSAYKFKTHDRKNRTIGSATLRYQALDWLYLSGRAGLDHYTTRLTTVEPWGTAYRPLGAMREAQYNSTQVDADFMIGIEKNITDKIATNTILGAGSNTVKFEKLERRGENFIVPGLETIGNTANLVAANEGYEYTEKKINSLYASIELSYDEFLFLTLTGRNDWFSTLSAVGKTTPNNDFYYSANTSFVFTDALQMPEWISFGKIRAGYSSVAGGADDPYRLSLLYEIFGNHLGNPIGQISGDQIPNAYLKPYTKEEYEIGTDLKFFNNRIGIDFSWYYNKTTDDIVEVNRSVSTGYRKSLENLGILENKGIELLLTATPVRNENLRWNVSYNLGYNESKVVATDENNNDVTLGVGYGFADVRNVVGKPYGQIYGTTYARDENNQIIYQDDGRPVVGDRGILGDGVPPWTMGLNNSFSYKNFNLDFLIDAKFGGKIWSGTSAWATYNGLSKNTLEGRENGLTVAGVNQQGNSFTTTIADPDRAGEEGEIALQDYYQRVYEIAEEHIQSADFIKFRQISLGYSLPSEMLENTFLTAINFSLIGRNLFFIKRDADNIDPESAFNNSNAQGLERFGVPSTRSYGLSVNIKF
ncbi:SusC/RagA family TonB-linked outer membrane protein [Sinomicrobium sp. M5D2P17]